MTYDPGNSKKKGVHVFGSELADLPLTSEHAVPRVVYELATYILTHGVSRFCLHVLLFDVMLATGTHVEGLFRVPASVKSLQHFRDEYNK